MEIIPLIPERDVAIQRTRVAQDRDTRAQAKACLLLGRYYTELETPKAGRYKRFF